MSWAAEELDLREELGEATQQIAQSTGIIVPEYRLPVVQAELERIGGEAGVRRGLERFLVDEDARSDVVRAVAIPETYMFRHGGHFEILRNLAELRAAAGRATRVLCAGCSTGEEVWSTAAVLASVPPPKNNQHRVVGWDLCSKRLEHARVGQYTRWACRKGFEQYGHLFDEHSTGFTVTPSLRALVRFAAVNLVRDTLPEEEPFDAVLFRNVSIYWDANTTGSVLDKLTPLIGNVGLLLVGPSDPVVLPKEGWQHLITKNARCYQRRKQQTSKPTSVNRPAEPVRASTKKPSRNLPVPSSPVLSLRLERLIDETPRATPVVTQPSPSPQPDPVFDEIRTLADAGRYQEALAQIDSIPDKNTTEAKLWRGILLLALDEVEEAIKIFRQCVFLQPENVEHRQWLAVSYESAGRNGEAEREFRNAAELGQ